MLHCTECGYQSIKWLGRCPNCSGWETFAQEPEQDKTGKVITSQAITPQLLSQIESQVHNRISSQISELDRILGGGVVEGEIILIGGEPGVGKSTLLLEVCFQLSKSYKTLYVSAEESPQQIALRAQRLDKQENKLYILGEDNLETVAKYIQEEEFKFVVIDSIQVVYSPSCQGGKGSVSQLKGSADYLTQIAKTLGVVIFIVGHVTKEGVIAGPKLLEHIVDCVLYFEGENLSQYRILRAVKNRFGATGEIAVFEMTGSGLIQVDKTTDLFLPHIQNPVAGSCVISAIEGIRPILIELQALVSKANFGLAKRRCLGFDYNRFSLLIAIIEKKLKISLGNEDVFLNVAGGLKINDPAADLGIVLAILSSLKDKEILSGSVFIGEVGLASELRRVHNINARLKEVQRANFKRCFIPEINLKEVDIKSELEIYGYKSLIDVVNVAFSIKAKG